MSSTTRPMPPQPPAPPSPASVGRWVWLIAIVLLLMILAAIIGFLSAPGCNDDCDVQNGDVDFYMGRNATAQAQVGRLARQVQQANANATVAEDRIRTLQSDLARRDFVERSARSTADAANQTLAAQGIMLTSIAQATIPPPTATPLPPTPTPSPPPPPIEATVLTYRSIIRQGPADDAPLVGILTHDTTVTVIGRSPDGDWLQIRLVDGTQGFARVATLQITSGNLNSLPMPPPPAGRISIQPTEIEMPYMIIPGEPLFREATGFECNWQGLAGTVDQMGFQVQVRGPDVGLAMQISGANDAYGPGGWEIQVAGRPVAGMVLLQLFNEDGTMPLSPVIEVQFPGDCAATMVMINFVRVE